ncbi:MAG: tetraacyldisaccharide 4'-kinase [Chitinophagaceae bacterium]|nr:MAG: tetraacyldisaccharide 4'-kinase [Chitinophagaceae bacterium]
MFSNWFLKSFRILLFPLAFLYGGIVILRNWLFNKGVFKSVRFNLPIVCVGNLSVGGTGKSPMVEYLIARLKGSVRVATLSRGYKRKTRGYALAGPSTTALDIGDEPMLFHRKFPDVPVAVGEKRLEAIPQLLHDHPETEVILLDDAFQHRAVAPGFNILLTDHGNLYTRDFFLPTGDLRDQRSSAARAQVIVVTKCPPGLTEEEKRALTEELAPDPGQELFFTTIAYGTAYHILSREPVAITEDTEVLLVTGIANPRPLKEYLEERTGSYSMMHFGDHHIFTIDDWREIQQRFAALEGPEKIILTTEKDAMRLLKFENELAALPFYVLPIEPLFLFGDGTRFDSIVHTFIQEFKQTQQHGQRQ